MEDRVKEVETAISLMRMALALLDRAGARIPATHLEHVISLAIGESSRDVVHSPV